MRSMNNFSLAVTILALGLTTSAQGSTGTQTETIENQISFIEQSVNSSSVTALHSEEDRARKLRLLQLARGHLEQNQINTAMELVGQTGRLLYPMNPKITNAEASESWTSDVVEVIGAMLPVAYEIALAKGEDTTALRSVKERFEVYTLERASGIDLSLSFLIETYNELQSEIVLLRSEDYLTIALPTGANSQAWQDAERRYHDWRFTTEWMVSMADSMGVDGNAIYEGNLKAENLYQLASEHADEQSWALALATIDQAYLSMESAWRQAGVDL